MATSTTTVSVPFPFTSLQEYETYMARMYEQDVYTRESALWQQRAADAIRIFDLRQDPQRGAQAQQAMVQYVQPMLLANANNPHIQQALQYMTTHAHAPLEQVHAPAIQYRMNVAQDQTQQQPSPQPGKNNNWELEAAWQSEMQRQRAYELYQQYLAERRAAEEARYRAALQAVDIEMEPATHPVEWARDPVPQHGPLGAVTTSSAIIHPGVMRTRIFADLREKLISEEVYRPCNRWRTGDPVVE